MARQRKSIFPLLFSITAWIMVLSAFGVTLKDIISFNWTNDAMVLLANFFTW